MIFIKDQVLPSQNGNVPLGLQLMYTTAKLLINFQDNPFHKAF
jgi:hypothetical protein